MAKTNGTRGKAVAIVAVLALMLVLAPFQAWAAPVLGGIVTAAGGDVKVKFVSSDAAFRSFLQFYSPTTGTLVAANIFNSDTTAAGTEVNLGSFAPGTPLIFSIKVDENLDGIIDHEYFIGKGDGSSSANPLNPDGLAHATVDFAGAASYGFAANSARIGFEDLLGGGDLDFNDHIFDFIGLSTRTPVPNPTGLLLLGLGLTGMAGWSRIRSRKQ